MIELILCVLSFLGFHGAFSLWKFHITMEDNHVS